MSLETTCYPKNNLFGMSMVEKDSTSFMYLLTHLTRMYRKIGENLYNCLAFLCSQFAVDSSKPEKKPTSMSAAMDSQGRRHCHEWATKKYNICIVLREPEGACSFIELLNNYLKSQKIYWSSLIGVCTRFSFLSLDVSKGCQVCLKWQQLNLLITKQASGLFLLLETLMTQVFKL